MWIICQNTNDFVLITMKCGYSLVIAWMKTNTFHDDWKIYIVMVILCVKTLVTNSTWTGWLIERISSVEHVKFSSSAKSSQELRFDCKPLFVSPFVWPTFNFFQYFSGHWQIHSIKPTMLIVNTTWSVIKIHSKYIADEPVIWKLNWIYESSRWFDWLI